MDVVNPKGDVCPEGDPAEMIKIFTVILMIAILGSFLTCSAYAQGTGVTPATSPTGNDVTVQESPPIGYKLQKEDTLKVSVWNEPNFSADLIIDPSGYVTLPYLNPIHAEGMTQAELTEQIRQGLLKYLVDPKVRIEISQFRKPKVNIVGQVNRPSVYEFRYGATVMEAISMAGSYTEAANLEEATLTRKGSPVEISLNLNALFYEGAMSQNYVLEDGDSIFIPEMKMYTVVGEVLKQGQYRLRSGTTVMDAISNAGGATERASLKSTYVLRGDLSNPERIKVNIDKYMKNSDPTQNILIKPGDVVYVAETNKPNWEKVGKVLSSVVNASYIFRLFGL